MSLARVGITPQFNLGKTRTTMLNEAGGYRIYSSRINEEIRKKIRHFVDEEGLYTNIEDFLEDSTYRFFTEKPYVHGITFMFPRTAIAHIRKSDIGLRTGWRQINFLLNEDLAHAVKAEVEKLRTYNRSISMSSYLFTGLVWYLDKLSSVPENHLEQFKRKEEKIVRTKVGA